MGKKGALTKDNPARSERDKTIATERLKGKTYRELSEQFGLSKSMIHNILHDDEIKDVIETGQKEMVRLIPKAVDNYEKLLDCEDDKIRLQASKDCLQTTGVMPSHTPNVLIQQVFNRGADSETAEEIATLREFLRQRLSGGLQNNQKETVVDSGETETN